MSQFEEVEIGPCRLINGDCLQVLRTLGHQDAIVSDPPYGINFEYESHDDFRAGWYDLMDAFVPLARSVADFVVIPCCGIDRLGWWYEHHKPDWLIAWYKGSPGHRSAIGFNDWEAHLVWGKPPKPMHDYFQTPLTIGDHGHPCEKPVAYAEWLVKRAAKLGGTVVDPFMGSGTTGVACVRLGRKFIGIEKEPKYFDICCQRIEQAWTEKRSELQIDEAPVMEAKSVLW